MFKQLRGQAYQTLRPGPLSFSLIYFGFFSDFYPLIDVIEKEVQHALYFLLPVETDFVPFFFPVAIDSVHINHFGAHIPYCVLFSVLFLVSIT